VAFVAGAGLGRYETRSKTGAGGMGDVYLAQDLDALKRRMSMALTNGLAGRNLGLLVLGIWLILTGLLPLLNMRLSSTVTTGLAVLGIVAGILILLRR
jgi:hypothetical protein